MKIDGDFFTDAKGDFRLSSGAAAYDLANQQSHFKLNYKTRSIDEVPSTDSLGYHSVEDIIRFKLQGEHQKMPA
ncbi:MAG: hypothetical protein V4721_08200 [Bacteroidota bacterium]